MPLNDGKAIQTELHFDDDEDGNDDDAPVTYGAMKRYVAMYASDAQKEKMAKTMGEFSEGELRSGSKDGPKVQDRSQAVAIGLSQSGQSNK